MEWTKDEIARIRPAFSGNGQPGILESIVRTGHERTRDNLAEPEELVLKYSALGCHGVVQLINLLQNNAEIKECGSGSIDLEGVTFRTFSINAADRLQELYIGNPKFGITPLQWLAYLADGLRDVVPEQVTAFDQLCDSFAVMLDALQRGDYKEVGPE